MRFIQLLTNKVMNEIKRNKHSRYVLIENSFERNISDEEEIFKCSFYLMSYFRLESCFAGKG